VSINVLHLNFPENAPHVFERTLSRGSLQQFQRHAETVGRRPHENFEPAFRCHRRYRTRPSGDRQRELKEQKWYAHEKSQSSACRPRRFERLKRNASIDNAAIVESVSARDFYIYEYIKCVTASGEGWKDFRAAAVMKPKRKPFSRRAYKYERSAS